MTYEREETSTAAGGIEAVNARSVAGVQGRESSFKKGKDEISTIGPRYSRAASSQPETILIPVINPSGGVPLITHLHGVK